MARSPDLNELMRTLPSVEELAASVEGVSHATAVRAARAAIAARRDALVRGETPPEGRTLADDALDLALAEAMPSLKRDAPLRADTRTSSTTSPAAGVARARRTSSRCSASSRVPRPGSW